MRCNRSSGAHPAPLRVSGILVLAGLCASSAVRAQSQITPSPGSSPDPPATSISAAPPDLAPPESAFDQAAPLELVQGARRDAQIGLAGWDHTLLGAFELGERLFRLADAALTPSSLRTKSADPASTFLRYSSTGSRPSLDSIAHALRVDQLQRQGMNLHMSSPFGSFRLTYREIFAARANSLGGGVGQASAAAMYTTPRFGAGRLMDFSAAALMGNGQINQLLGTGFGSSVIGGNGPVLRKSPGPTVALKLTF